MSFYPYLGNNVDPVSVKELSYRGLLQEGETPMALFDGVLLDDRGRRVGGVSLTDFVALTDQRLITWARGFFNDMVDGFVWKDVDVVEAKTWDPLHGRVCLAFRVVPEVPRARRIAVKGYKTTPKPEDLTERILVNTLDYMPAADVPVLAEMVEWIGDQVVAGIVGDELFAAFADMFPLPESDEPATQFVSPPPPQPQPEAEPYQEPKRRWWSFGGEEPAQKDQSVPNVDSPDKLIAAYELQRGGEPAAPASPGAPLSSRSGIPPFGQFGFYDVSRGMRLLFEGPRRMGGSLNRVNEALVDTAELIEDMQDPQKRKRTLSGLRFAMDMQESQSGLLGAVAPVVRAVLGPGSNESGSHEGDSDRPAVRRIQVRAAVRQREAATQGDSANHPGQSGEEMYGEVGSVREPSVRKRQSSESGNASGNDVPPTPAVSARAKVRRHMGEQGSQEPAPVSASSVGVSQNHDESVDHTEARQADEKGE